MGESTEILGKKNFLMPVWGSPGRAVGLNPMEATQKSSSFEYHSHGLTYQTRLRA